VTVVLAHVDAALKRWDSVKASNALRAVDPTRIYAESTSAPDGELSGLLCSIKDLLPVAGVESCAGSLTLEGNIPDHESALVETLRGSGAVIAGKGVCAEFGFGVDTENRLDGRVTNPLDPTISPGGSSGGDAVAVGTGVVDFAIAGDYGGSTRWPAQAMKVLGLRIGVGRAPERNQIGSPSSGLQARLDVPGVLARDPQVLQRVVQTLLADADPAERRGRLLVLPPIAFGAVTNHVITASKDAVRRFEDLGYTAKTADETLQRTLIDAVTTYGELRRLTDLHDGVRAIVAGKEDLLCASTRAVLDAAAANTAQVDEATVAQLTRRADEIAATVAAALDEFDALLMPIAASGSIGFASTTDVGGAQRNAVALHAHLRAVSLTGLPALALPVRDHVAVQLVGAPRTELSLCDLATDFDERSFS
jgi:amidase